MSTDDSPLHPPPLPEFPPLELAVTELAVKASDLPDYASSTVMPLIARMESLGSADPNWRTMYERIHILIDHFAAFLSGDHP